MKATATKLLAHVGFWLATIVLIATIWTMYDASNKGYQSSQWVAHTQDVLQGLAEISAAASRSESAQRGYLLTGNTQFAVDRDAALARENEAVARMAQLIVDNPTQKLRLAQLEKLVAARLNIMMENAELRQMQGIEIAQSRVSSGNGQRASAAIYELAAEMAAEE